MDCECLINWELLLEYIRVFVWPIIAVSFALIFKDDVKTLIKRISYSKKIKFAGLEADLSESTDLGLTKSKITPEIKKEIEAKTELLSFQNIRNQSNDFTKQELPERRRRAKIIYNEAINLNKQNIEELINEIDDDRLVTWLIVINSQIENTDFDISKFPKYQDLIALGLEHPHSLIRFRAVEVVHGNEFLAKKLKDKIVSLRKHEKNNATRMLLSYIGDVLTTSF